MGITRYSDQSLSVGAVGTTVTTSGSSASTAIPNDASGNRARFVRITAVAPCNIKFTKGAGTCTANDIQIAANYPEVYDVKNFDTVNYIQISSATTLNITPLEG